MRWHKAEFSGLKGGLVSEKKQIDGRFLISQWTKSTLLAGVLLLPCAAYAQSAQSVQAPAEPRFDVQRYDVSGNTLLSKEQIDRVLSPYTGKQRYLADVRRAQEDLTAAYRDLGYGTVQVLLPEQNINDGVIRLRVLQPKVGTVLLGGNKHFDNENIRRSLPTLKEGEVPNSGALARNLQITGEHPVKRTTLLMRTAENPETVDVNVKVEDERPWRFVATLDNTGNGDTGYLRSGIGFQHTNLFNRDHVLSAQYVTSPTHVSKVSIFGVGYHAPYYRLNSSVDVFAGYSDVNSGIVQGLFNVAGSGTIFGARWNYYLPKWGTADQKLSFGVDYRAFHNDVTLAGVGLVPDITIRPVSLTYSGSLKGASSEVNYSASLSANMPGGNDGKAADFARSRFNANENYKIFRYSASVLTSFAKEWQARAAVNGQYTEDALVSGEQFGLGGPESVRGYLVRELSNDKGVSAQFEVFTPELARKVGLPDGMRLRALGFYDVGTVSRNRALPGEVTSKTISDVGLGIRMHYGKSMSLRVDVAHVLRDAGTRQAGDNRISAGLALVF
jgi:hemolysin activation/secretion protein